MLGVGSPTGTQAALPTEKGRMRIGTAGMRGWWTGWGLLLASSAFGQTTSIVYTIDSGQMDLMSVPLLVEGGNTLSNVFKDASSSAVFYFWSEALQAWQAVSKPAQGWDAGSGSHPLPPGLAFFYQPPDFSGPLVIDGEPPAPPISTNLPGWGRVSCLGYPYPADMCWTNLQLAALLPAGSMVAFWDRTNGVFRPTFLKAPAAKGGGWGAAASNHVVHAGDGFAVVNFGTNFIWSE